MKLESISYTEFPDTLQVWRLEEVTLGDRNLLVGKNAAGKSRTLNIIGALSQHLAGERSIANSGIFLARFRDDANTIVYRLETETEEVIAESVEVNGVVKLKRWKGGQGEIWAEKENKQLDFQTPPTQLAVVARQDAIQHTFLLPLAEWGKSLRHYHFGTALGKHSFVMVVEGAKVGQPNERDADTVVALFRKGEKEFEKKFVQDILDDMMSIDYPLTSISTGRPLSVRFEGAIPVEPIGIVVQEQNLPGLTDQHSMSQGMFRALSLIIHLNYAINVGRGTCVLIDDIGEGLDFDRSCRLIDLLRRKAEAAGIQLIMATNDRFVMNRVPLKEWSVLFRTRNIVQAKNYHNSREAFEEFEFTGLNNFDFFATDYLVETPEEEIAGRE